MRITFWGANSIQWCSQGTLQILQSNCNGRCRLLEVEVKDRTRFKERKYHAQCCPETTEICPMKLQCCALYKRIHECIMRGQNEPRKKTAGSGTAQSTLCPSFQWIPIYLSPLLLYPVLSLAPCPHLRWGRAAETKEKQPVWEHVSHPHMVLAPSPPSWEFVSQPYSLVILWCYG